MVQIDKLRAQIEHGLDAFFERKLQDVSKECPDAGSLVCTLQEFTMRPGKRIRPLMVLAGHSSISGEVGDPSVINASLAVELLQSYLLIQDDWMDADKLRRGKPAVHYGFLAEYKHEHLANTVAILVSDLASSFAEEIISHSGFEAEPVRRAMRAYSRMHQSVILGQYLDVSEKSTVDIVHQLKTASYTVIGPLLLGAELAMADESQLHTLREFGHKLGLAFQLKDDLIGTFGNSDSTGKATDADIRSQKRTALTAELFRQAEPAEHAALTELLNQENMNVADIQRIRNILVDRGIRDTIEVRAQTLADDAINILRGSNLASEGKDILLTLTEMLTRRTH